MRYLYGLNFYLINSNLTLNILKKSFWKKPFRPRSLVHVKINGTPSFSFDNLQYDIHFFHSSTNVVFLFST